MIMRENFEAVIASDGDELLASDREEEFRGRYIQGRVKS